jgi:Family of unknown function (DUF6293)
LTLNTKQIRLSVGLDTLRIHIAPVGFESDRIVIPALEMKADRVWLIVHSGRDADKGTMFRESVSEKLKKAGIECEFERADRTDLFDTLRALKKIILRENKNTLYVNVSVGSKIQSIACTMICMMFKEKVAIKPYYAVPQAYNVPTQQESIGVSRVISLPDYKIEMPSDKLVRCLEIINERKGSIIGKKDLRDKTLEIGLIHVEKGKNKDQSAYMALNKNLIDPLLEWKFITVEKIGRKSVISITTDGLNVLKFLGE